MRFSVLHISDLHRDPQDEVGNGALLDSLEHDLDRCSEQNPQILRPSICIVTGDMIHGVAAGVENYEVELRRQYAQASEFLVGLANRFFGGRRERIVILPGNHDVCFEDVAQSVSPIPTPSGKEERIRLVKKLEFPNTGIRWSWSDLQFFQITDTERYQKRFRFFAEFYEAFYAGARTFSADPEQQFDVFDFPDERFSVVTLNSCYNNDSLRRYAAVNPAAVIEACRRLREIPRIGWTAAVAWHHNVAAMPGQEDFLHPEFVQSLIDSGAAIAFHGHQHMPDCFDEFYRLGPTGRRMTVISASTLCAEPKHLVAGVPRSYNIIEIDAEEMTGRVHQRRMVNLQMTLPVWGAGQFVANGKSYFDFAIAPPLGSVASPDTHQLEVVDQLMGEGKLAMAFEAIQPIRTSEDARPYLVELLDRLGDPSKTIETLGQPRTAREVVLLADAISLQGSKEAAGNFLALDLGQLAEDASVRDVVQRIRRKLG